jgi:rhodanese-related sulfurtransferase
LPDFGIPANSEVSALTAGWRHQPHPKEPHMPSLVTQPGFADAATALAHFERRLGVETDCSDVHESLKGEIDFVLVDVRGPHAFAAGHVPGAVNIPHRTMTAERMAEYPISTRFVVYCAGPHCNGANKGAIRLARLGFPVKEMIGGITGWLDEGFALDTSAALDTRAA